MRSMTRTLLAAIAAFLLAEAVAPAAHADVQYVMCLDKITGSSTQAPECIDATAVGLSIERAMKSSGEKGGTADINIGVGELAPVTVRKPVDGASAELFMYGTNGNSFGNAHILAIEDRVGWNTPQVVLEIRLQRAFVAGMRLDPDSAHETIELYFNQIRVTSYSRDQYGQVTASSDRCWDKVKMKTCATK